MSAAPDTPFLAVDPDVLERNLTASATRAAERGLAWRPHAKTHKCVEIARRQLAHGAAGLTVATVGEAETFADAGCTDLFVAYPVWASGARAARIRALAQRTALRIGVTSVEGVRALATALDGVPAQVLVEVDSGHHRTGVAPADAGALARGAADAGLDVIGIFTFPGHSYGPGRREAVTAEESAALAEAAESLRAAGLDPVVRSGGSTPTEALSDGPGKATGSTATGPGVTAPGDIAPGDTAPGGAGPATPATPALTEIRPGVSVFHDAQQVELGVAGFGDVALTAVATVVHRDGDRIVLDAGSKTLGADQPGWISGGGRLPGHPDARIVALSEHHATAVLPAGSAVPAPGERVGVVPNHVCAAVNLADELIVVSGGEVVDLWPVAARGANT
ncbi:D-serine deaminase-like pyridoxal phosphate-dependent protein [Pseudonocardia sediminis]|uniref:D-serine deaminase-like pyridoxal phosphate-dependent protein n=1 Tax=Pseudonocardia sediminis TaxID=1397368 RepID=A0A4Q7UUG3_PSEST|nr:alanine racemase [Pseudonocardia sediminis]RZT85386.1 D-serine deaminase-like pyridoxal phosphate-dependent protein [Pseudonocardia sediminis]